MRAGDVITKVSLYKNTQAQKYICIFGRDTSYNKQIK